MRRLLRKIATKETDSLGDISTLADETVVQTLIDAGNNNLTKQNMKQERERATPRGME